MSEPKAKSFLDLMPEDKRQAYLNKYKERRAKKEAQTLEIPYSWYVTAQLGYYYGWDAVMAVRNGYTVSQDVTRDGQLIHRKNTFTLEEAMMLIDAARKVWNSQVIDTGYAHMVGSGAKYAEKPNETYEQGMQGFQNQVRIK